MDTTRIYVPVKVPMALESVVHSGDILAGMSA